MKLRSILLFIGLYCCQLLPAQQIDLSIINIPDSLKKDANSIIRYQDTNIELISSKKMVITVRRAITVFNKNGDRTAEITVPYDKSTRIKSIDIISYNAFGKEENKITKKEIKDYSAADGSNLFEDNRLVHYAHVAKSYPYTLSLEYVIESSTTAFIPAWVPVSSFVQSVQSSSFKISYPNDIKLQKAAYRLDEFRVKKTEEINKLSYELKNIPAIKYEELAPAAIDLVPYVKLAANKFHLEGVDGQANTWQEFGKWMYDNLISTRSEIPEATKNHVRNLVKNIDDPIKKAKIVYGFVQNKTRYISIQVGIGGWMPMLASDVDRLSYGDCKALTNYTKVLMDAVGVPSYYSAVYGGSEKIDMENDVVSVQGNHVILYVPNKEQDIWLECTSQTTPFGYQGTFTDDRNALVIRPEGGLLKRTGVFDDKANYQYTKAHYSLEADGSITGQVEIASAGVQYDAHYGLEKKSERDIKDYYKNSYWSYINNLMINENGFINDRDSIIFKEKIKIQATEYGSFSGDRLLFIVNAFNRNTYVPNRYRNRVLPFEINRGYVDKDEFVINLPQGYSIEAKTEDQLIKNKFGSYQFSIEELSPDKIKYTRTLFIKKGRYANTEFDDFREFRREVAKLDKTKIVLLKN